MDSDEGQREVLLSGEAEKGATSPSVPSSTFKTALQVMSMLLLVVILCTLVAGIAFVAGTRSNESPEEDGQIVVLVRVKFAVIIFIILGLFICSHSCDNSQTPMHPARGSYFRRIIIALHIHTQAQHALK